MLLFVYSSLIYLALPVILGRLWWRARKESALGLGWQQRLGYLAPSVQPVIWIHAVSVGETIAAAPLVHLLRSRHPTAPILITAMTLTGAERARALFGDTVDYAYVPYDYPGAIARFLKRVKPRALIIMETELWPNIITRTHAAGVPIIVANARLSERSAKGYRKVAWLSRELFRKLDWVAAQASPDAERFIEAGARQGAVSVTGSIKFDVSISAGMRAASDAERARLGADTRPVWIAASTHEGEDAILLDAHRELLRVLPDLLLILVPRHPERFRTVARLARDRGFSLARRSAGESATAVQVYLADTMGELLMLYGVADVAFIGGSLIRRGGHNPLEAAAWGIPVLSGPHVFNFADIYTRLEEGGGLVRAGSADALVAEVQTLMSNEALHRQKGRNAESVLIENQGALKRLLGGIEHLLDQGPDQRP